MPSKPIKISCLWWKVEGNKKKGLVLIRNGKSLQKGKHDDDEHGKDAQKNILSKHNCKAALNYVNGKVESKGKALKDTQNGYTQEKKSKSRETKFKMRWHFHYKY